MTWPHSVSQNESGGESPRSGKNGRRQTPQQTNSQNSNGGAAEVNEVIADQNRADRAEAATSVCRQTARVTRVVVRRQDVSARCGGGVSGRHDGRVGRDLTQVSCKRPSAQRSTSMTSATQPVMITCSLDFRGSLPHEFCNPRLISWRRKLIFTRSFLRPNSLRLIGLRCSSTSSGG
jgi:hypothetical protein